MTEFAVPALSIDDLAARTGVPDLAARLEGAGVRLMSRGDHMIVLSDDWFAYLGTTIRASGSPVDRGEASSTGNDRDPHANITVPTHGDHPREGVDDEAETRSIIRAEGWDDQRRGMFSRYPWVAESLESFLAYLAKQRPETVINQTRSTVTLILPNGGWVGVYPKPTQGGLRLRAIRKGEPHYEFVKTADDFVRVVTWLDQLPAYGD